MLIYQNHELKAISIIFNSHRYSISRGDKQNGVYEHSTTGSFERDSRRIRKKIRGTSQRPRLSVFRSARHTYAQIIDDSQGRTLMAASTMDAS